jgi:hypothetical protein
MDRNIFLTQLKFLLGIDPTDTSRDAELLTYIEIAIGVTEEYLGRELDAKDHNEKVFDHCGDLVVRNWPINSVASLRTGGTNYGASNLKWSAKRNVLMYIVGYRHQRIAGDYIEISYNAGYSDVIPQWLLTAVSYIAAAYENIQGKGGISTTPGSGEVKQFSIPGVYSETYDVGSTSSGGISAAAGDVGFMPEEARSLLAMYRDKRVA